MAFSPGPERDCQVPFGGSISFRDQFPGSFVLHAQGGENPLSPAQWLPWIEGGEHTLQKSVLPQVAGAAVQAFDPTATAAASEALQDNRVRFCSSAYEAATRADALAILTEWNEFRNLDLNEAKKVMKGHLIFDGRNVLDPDAVVSHGFTYFGRGRSPQSIAQPASPRLTSVGAGESAGAATLASLSETGGD